VTLRYTDKLNKEHFLLVLPIKEGLNGFSNNPVLLDNIQLPFSYDLISYNMYVTQSNGKLDCYKHYFNTGPGAFYPITLKELDMECDKLRRGEMNTRCTFKFKPNFKMQRNAQIFLDFVGMEAHSNKCSWSQEIGSSIFSDPEPVQCESNLKGD